QRRCAWPGPFRCDHVSSGWAALTLTCHHSIRLSVNLGAAACRPLCRRPPPDKWCRLQRWWRMRHPLPTNFPEPLPQQPEYNDVRPFDCPLSTGPGGLMSLCRPVLRVLIIAALTCAALGVARAQGQEEPNPIAAKVKSSIKDPARPFTMIVHLKVKEGAGK